MPGVVNVKKITLGSVDFQLVEVGAGKWCWTTPGFSWCFDERVPPGQNNVGLMMEGRYHYQLRIDPIEMALVYTLGFSYGYKNGMIQGKADYEGSVALAQQAFKSTLDKPTDRPEVKADGGITGNRSLP